MSTLSDALEAMDKDCYPDEFSRLVSECRSHLNGVITLQTTKKEKIDFAFKALEKLNRLENLWNGISDDEQDTDALDALIARAKPEEETV